jgi:serine/threonine protein kinase
LAIHKKTKEKVAIKFLKAASFGKNINITLLSLGTAQDIDLVFTEAQTLRNLNHKNIVKILNCFTLKNMQVAFVMEYLEGGELKDYIISKGHLEEEEARPFFKQLAEAVYYLHREKFIHRDLKLENILLESLSSKIIKVI